MRTPDSEKNKLNTFRNNFKKYSVILAEIFYIGYSLYIYFNWQRLFIKYNITYTQSMEGDILLIVLCQISMTTTHNV